MLLRQTRNLLREPIWIATLLTQPIVWLVLYGQLFERVVELPGFRTDSYVQFLTPGVVVMTAFFSATWSGLSMIEDIDRGVIERFLATPARRSALVLGHVAHSVVTRSLQALIILVTGLFLGARVHGGALAWVALIAAAALVAAGFSALSHGLALLTRREATMIALANFLALPLMFLSAMLIAEELMPAWMRWAARFNPVNWAVVAGREAVDRHTDWSVVGLHLALLLAFAAAMSAFATWTFRVYRRTL